MYRSALFAMATGKGNGNDLRRDDEEFGRSRPNWTRRIYDTPPSSSEASDGQLEGQQGGWTTSQHNEKDEYDVPQRSWKSSGWTEKTYPWWGHGWSSRSSPEWALRPFWNGSKVATDTREDYENTDRKSVQGWYGEYQSADSRRQAWRTAWNDAARHASTW